MTTPTSLVGFNHLKILGIREGFCKGMGVLGPRYALCLALFWPGPHRGLRARQFSPSVPGPCLDLMGPCQRPLGPHDWGLAQRTVPSAAAIEGLGEGLNAPPGQQVGREAQCFVQRWLRLGPQDCPPPRPRQHHRRACSALGIRRGLQSPMGFVKPTPIKKSVIKASREHSVIPAGTLPPFFLPQERGSTQTCLMVTTGDRGAIQGYGPGGRSSGTTATASPFWLTGSIPAESGPERMAWGRGRTRVAGHLGSSCRCF